MAFSNIQILLICVFGAMIAAAILLKIYKSEKLIAAVDFVSSFLH